MTQGLADDVVSLNSVKENKNSKNYDDYGSETCF